MLKSCRGCGRSVPITKLIEGRCARCSPAHQARRQASRPARDRSAQQRFRLAVLERDGHQCTYVGLDGRRCPEVRHLVAHHVIGIRDLPADRRYDPQYGVTSCRRHHPAGTAGGPLQCSWCHAPQGSTADEHVWSCPFARRARGERV